MGILLTTPELQGDQPESRMLWTRSMIPLRTNVIMEIIPIYQMFTKCRYTYTRNSLVLTPATEATEISYVKLLQTQILIRFNFHHDTR